MTTYLLSSNDWLILVGKKVYPRSYLYFHWTSLVSLCIRASLELFEESSKCVNIILYLLYVILCLPCNDVQLGRLSNNSP